MFSISCNTKEDYDRLVKLAEIAGIHITQHTIQKSTHTVAYDYTHEEESNDDDYARTLCFDGITHAKYELHERAVPLTYQEVLNGFNELPEWVKVWNTYRENPDSAFHTIGVERVRYNPTDVLGAHAMILMDDWTVSSPSSRDVLIALLKSVPRGTSIYVMVKELDRYGWGVEDILRIREGSVDEIAISYPTTLEEAKKHNVSHPHTLLNLNVLEEAFHENRLVITSNGHESILHCLSKETNMGCLSVFNCHPESNCVIWVS